MGPVRIDSIEAPAGIGAAAKREDKRPRQKRPTKTNGNDHKETHGSIDRAKRPAPRTAYRTHGTWGTNPGPQRGQAATDPGG